MFGSKNLLMNVTKTNKHSNVAAFFRALILVYVAIYHQFHIISYMVKMLTIMDTKNDINTKMLILIDTKK